jgi:hypothetical protein
MGLNTSIETFIERQTLNGLNHYILYFCEEFPNQLDQDEIIEVLDQAKANDPEWHGAMVTANIDSYQIFHDKAVSYFNCLDDL